MLWFTLLKGESFFPQNKPGMSNMPMTDIGMPIPEATKLSQARFLGFFMFPAGK